MANQLLGAESAPSNVIQFPVRNKGRVRKSKGFQAEGVFSMMRCGKYPANVAHFEQNIFADIELVDLLAYGFEKLRMNLPAATSEAIYRQTLMDAALSKDPRKRRIAAAMCGRFDHGAVRTNGQG